MRLLVRRVTVALELGDVALGDQVAVEIDLDLAADDLDLREIPHAGLAHIAAAAGEVRVLAPDLLARVVAERRHDAVDRARVLVGLELVGLLLGVIVLAAAVIQELKLAHAVVGGVLAGLHSHAQAVVAVLGHHELESKDEVRVGTVGIALGEALKDAGLLLIDAVHRTRTRPARQIPTIEKRDESLVNHLRIPRFLLPCATPA